MLTFDNVRFQYAVEDFSIIDHLSFEVQDGEFVSIIGASGCGKSTIFRLVNKLLTPASGVIRVDGESIETKKNYCGYMPQQDLLFPWRTVRENLMLPMEIQGGYSKEQMQKKADDALRSVGLADWGDKTPKELSGGMRQRAAFARTVLTGSDLLLLDEPFSAMDTHLRERLRLELASVLSEYQGASVMVTHDRDEAYQLCDTLLLLSRGQVIAAGKTKELFQDPGSVEAARLTGCKNISRIEKIDDHRVCALDWDNLELSTEKTVTEDVTSIGIRAHDFEPVKDPEGINHIPVGHAKISEMPFEWYVTLQNGLWWKIGKTIHTHSADGLIPEYVRVAPEAILLLKG